MFALANGFCLLQPSCHTVLLCQKGNIDVLYLLISQAFEAW
jgi:hypothetical protein